MSFAYLAFDVSTKSLLFQAVEFCRRLNRIISSLAESHFVRGGGEGIYPVSLFSFSPSTDPLLSSFQVSASISRPERFSLGNDRHSEPRPFPTRWFGMHRCVRFRAIRARVNRQHARLIYLHAYLYSRKKSIRLVLLLAIIF